MACPEEEECQGKPGARTHSVRRVDSLAEGPGQGRKQEEEEASPLEVQ